MGVLEWFVLLVDVDWSYVLRTPPPGYPYAPGLIACIAPPFFRSVFAPCFLVRFWPLSWPIWTPFWSHFGIIFVTFLHEISYRISQHIFLRFLLLLESILAPFWTRKSTPEAPGREKVDLRFWTTLLAKKQWFWPGKVPGDSKKQLRKRLRNCIGFLSHFSSENI